MARRHDDDEDLAGDDEGHHTSDRKPRKNSRRDDDDDDGPDPETASQLRSFIERVERLEEEKKTIQDDIKDVYGEAKGEGFDTKAMRTIVKMRKQDKDERMEQEAVLDTYLIALGMI